MSENIKKLEELYRRIAKPRLLAVDDDESFLELMGEMYSSDAELFCVDSGEKALQLLASGYKPDKVILDLRMPGMDGVETFREIKKLYPDLKVVIITGASENDDRLKEIPAIGWATIMSKPNSLEQFQFIKGALVGG